MRFFVPAALSVSASLAMVACEAPPAVDDVIDQRVDVPAPPAFGLQVVGPDLTVAPGEDVMLCWVPDMPARDVDMLVARFETFQGASGHHLLAMKSVIPREPGEQFDCTNLENMSTVRPLFTPNSANAEGTFNLLSSDFAVRLPKDAQIVMQSHYVNVNVAPIQVRDVGHLIFLPADEERIEANYFSVHNGTFSVPPTNERYTHSVDCVLEEDMQFASMIGHMHEWGKSILVEKIDSEGVKETLYEVEAWHAGLRDAPPVTHYPLDNALTVRAGETIRLTCEWINDTDEALGFPNEMCESMLVYYPARPEGFMICGE